MENLFLTALVGAISAILVSSVAKYLDLISTRRQYSSNKIFESKYMAFLKAMALVNRYFENLPWAETTGADPKISLSDLPSPKEVNDIVNELIVFSENPEIPSYFWKIFNCNVVKHEMRKQFLLLIRKELGLSIKNVDIGLMLYSSQESLIIKWEEAHMKSKTLIEELK